MWTSYRKWQHQADGRSLGTAVCFVLSHILLGASASMLSPMQDRKPQEQPNQPEAGGCQHLGTLCGPRVEMSEWLITEVGAHVCPWAPSSSSCSSSLRGHKAPRLKLWERTMSQMKF